MFCCLDGLVVLILANFQRTIISRSKFLNVPSTATTTKVLFNVITSNRKEIILHILLTSNMISKPIPLLIASTMSQCYVERLIMVKHYYSVARRPYLSPSFVAVFKRDSMMVLAKALSLWFVVRWASWSTDQNVFW